jgi:hypothetical protein
MIGCVSRPTRWFIGCAVGIEPRKEIVMPTNRRIDVPMTLVLVGITALAVCLFWPCERGYATTSESTPEFVMVTVRAGNALQGKSDPIDAVFVIDQSTGQLKGAALNRKSRKFASFYFRDLDADFHPNRRLGNNPRYCVASGLCEIPNPGNPPLSGGVLYIAEYVTGNLIAYNFNWDEAGTGAGALKLEALDFFHWRIAGQP